MAVDRKDKRFFDFMCSCKEEGQKKCDKVYDDVMQEFKDYYGSQKGRFHRDITDRDFVHCIVVGLDCMKNGQANIEGIYSDMWSGIAVKYYSGYQEELECEGDEDSCRCEKEKDYDCQYAIQQDFWIECDQIHHGLARAYQLVKEFDESIK